MIRCGNYVMKKMIKKNYYIPDDEDIMCQLKEFVNNNQQTLAIKSNMNTGKTQSVKSIVNNYFEKYDSDRRVLAFSLRQSYARDVSNNAYKELNFTNYLDIKKTKLKDQKRLIISLESLHKLRVKDIKMYDIIILDECESLLTHFFSKTVKSNRECYDWFVKLLTHSKKIICLDADLSISRSISFLESINRRIKILKNSYKAKSRRYKFINNYDKYYNQIKSDLSNGKNVCVVSVSKPFGLQLRDQLRKDFPEIADKIHFLYGDCDKSLKSQLKDVNTNWSDYRILIYNTVIGQGIDFNIENHFNHVMLYVLGNICSCREILQMLGRIRYPMNTDVLAMVDKSVNKNTDAFIYSLNYAKTYCSTLLADVPTDCMEMYYKDESGNTCMHLKEMNSMWNNLRASYVQERELNSGNKNIMAMMKLLIETNGDSYEEEYDTEIIRIYPKTNIDRIIEATTWTDDEYVDKKINGVSTEEDQLIMTKTELRQELNLVDTIPEDILNNGIQDFLETHIATQYALKYQNDKLINENDDEVKKSKFKHLKSACRNLLISLTFDNSDKHKEYPINNFEKRIKNINFNPETLFAMNIHNKKKNTYQISKAILTRFGIDVYKSYKDRFNKGVRIKDTFINLRRNKRIHEIIYCLISNNRNDYDKSFVDTIDNYNKYQDYITKK